MTTLWTGRRTWVHEVPRELNGGQRHPGGFGTIVGLASSLGITCRARVRMEDGITVSVLTEHLLPASAEPPLNFCRVWPER